MPSWPYTNQAIDLSQYTRLFGRMQDSGVSGPLGTTDLRATADGSGMAVTVAPGFAVIRGHAYYSTDPQALTVGASTATARIDSVVLRLNPALPDATKVVVAIKPGAATPPAMVQTETGIYEIELARITVPPSAVIIQANNVQDFRQYLGVNVRAWFTETRPVGALGVLGWNESLKLWEGWTGTAWAPIAPAITFTTLPGKPATYPPTIGAGADQAVAGNDPRLTNSRPPNAHNHDAQDITLFGTTPIVTWCQNTFVDKNDARLTNSRTPLVHDMNVYHSGILTIDKGGTGGNTATSALNALGIFVQSSQPAYAPGRVWIKIP